MDLVTLVNKTHMHLVTACSVSDGETPMDATDNVNTNNCQVILVTTEEWPSGMPLGECIHHTMLYSLFKNIDLVTIWLYVLSTLVS